ncbi:transposase [Pseudonocardia sp. H11422]|uniref:transposase n=1 Tax=Pseudonocardia sp. H11422 TaxID=2835866 RepID=UPI001BDDC414|nr:transposase [Pseudonocardia sp. H11422]
MPQGDRSSCRSPTPPEFRRRARDLLESGRSFRDVAASLGIAESWLHRWKSQDLLDRGLKAPTPEAIESAAPAAARARISELENEVKILRKAAAAVEEVVPPKVRRPLPRPRRRLPPNEDQFPASGT